LPETTNSTAVMAQRLVFWLPLIAAVLLLSACASQSSQSSAQEERPSGVGGGEETEQAGGELGDPALGDANAPVVMVEYADYQ
jgi:protein-disulfide isomerase